MNLSVRETGAIGDGQALDHPAIQKAIDRVAEQGGGTVVIPAGHYRCGTMRMRGHVHIYLAAGAVVKGSDDAEHYPVICPTTIGPRPRHYQALFWADDDDDIAVSGNGCIHGGGMMAMTGSEGTARSFRPGIFHLRNCQHVRIQDVRLTRSSFWAVHLLRCEDVHIKGLTISSGNRIGACGIVPDGCQRVVISDCSIQTGDDAVCLKSSEGDLCSHVTVANCILSSKRVALKLGAESAGMIRDVTVGNCVIDESFMALALHMKDGGRFENCSFSNLVMNADAEFPIQLDITPRFFDTPTVGHMRNIMLSGLIMSGRGRMLVMGHPGTPIENLTIRDLNWSITGSCDGPRAEMMPGSQHTRPDPHREMVEAHPFQFVFSHVRGLHMAGMNCTNGLRHAPLTDRGLCALMHVEGANLTDHVPFPQSPDHPPMLIRDCTGLHLCPLCSHQPGMEAVVTGLHQERLAAAHH